MARYGSALDEKMQQAEERDKNKKVQVKGPSGQLTSVTPSSLSQATELQTGGPSPVTPLGASQMGVGPDSAKMAGTQTQKDSAFRQAVDPSQQLSTVQRQQQGRQQTREEEQAKLEKSEQLQKLGGLGDQVYNLISGQFSDLQAKGEVKLEGAPEEIASALQSGDQAKITGAIQDWANKEISEGRSVNFETMKQMFPNPQDAIAAAVAAGIEDQLVVDDSMIQGLGFESLQDLEAQTGIQVPPGSTLQDVQSIVEGEITAEFDRTENLRQLMNDPNTSPQERAAARQELIDMGAIGLSAGEQAAHQVEQAVSEADEITFGGETVSLENLMNDEFVSGLAKRFFEDPEYAAKIKEENPEFASFLETNQTALQDLTAELDESVTQVTEAYDEQQKLKNLPDNLALNDEVIEAITGVEIDSYGADTSALTNSPLYKTLTDTGLTADERGNLVNQLETLSKISPEFAQSMAGLDKNTLRQLGAFDAEGGLLKMFQDSRFDSAKPELKYAFENIKTAQDLFDAQDRLNDFRASDAFGRGPGTYTKLEKELIESYPGIFTDGHIAPEEILDMPLGDLLKFADAAEGSATPSKTVRQEIERQLGAEMDSLVDPMAGYEIPEVPTGTGIDVPYQQELFRRDLNSKMDEIEAKIQSLKKLRGKYRGYGAKDIYAQIKELNAINRDLENKIGGAKYRTSENVSAAAEQARLSQKPQTLEQLLDSQAQPKKKITPQQQQNIRATGTTYIPGT